MKIGEWVGNIIKAVRGPVPHAFCPCQRHLTVCGMYSEYPQMLNDDEVDQDRLCPDCMQVLHSTGCLGCGCNESEFCALCRVAAQ